MIRNITVALMMLVLTTTMALAAEGYHSDVAMSISMDPAMLGEMGDIEGMDEMQNMNFTGQIYWTNDAFRSELDMGMLGGEMITIYDYQEMMVYNLDAESKTAMKMDLSAQLADMEESGYPDFNPDMLFSNWEKTKAMLETMPGITLEELGAEAVNGRACQKISMVMDMTAALEAEGLSAEEIAEMDMGGEMSGTYWIDDTTETPIKMDMTMMGTQIIWELTGIEDWKVDRSLLTVPADYEVMTMEEMMAEMMEAH